MFNLDTDYTCSCSVESYTPMLMVHPGLLDEGLGGRSIQWFLYRNEGGDGDSKI